MRGVFGLLGLVLVLAVVSVLVRKQLSVVAVPTATPGETVAPPGNAAEQSRRIQEQIKKDLEKALQQPRLAEEP